MQLLEQVNEEFALVGKGQLYQKIHDYTNAEKYYLLAVEKGYASAMYNIGFFYKDIKQDYVNAEKFYLLAAKKAYPNSLYTLAFFYENIKQDYINAEKYYLLAVEKDDANAMINLANLHIAQKQDYVSAERYYLMAIEKNNSIAMYDLALLYFINSNNYQKEKALQLVEKAIRNADSPNHKNYLLYIILLFWNNDTNKAKQEMIDFLKHDLHTEQSTPFVSRTLQWFLVFKQRQVLYKIFASNEQLIDRYKPVYYALLHQMQDEYPKEYLRMTEELQEPVNEILEFVRNQQERLEIK